jgi:hypothetical protein
MVFYHLALSTKRHSIFERVSLLEKVLGSSKVQPNNRITIIKQVQKKLKVKIGDVVIYIEDEKGNIIIKKGQLRPV